MQPSPETQSPAGGRGSELKHATVKARGNGSLSDVQTSTPLSENATAAMRYATRGWPVFPLHWITGAGVCSCGGSTCKSPGKHPLSDAAPRGVKNASPDTGIVVGWWTNWPQANIGLAMGAASGVFAVDVDPRNGGDVTLDELVGKHGVMPDTVIADTGGGGQHYLFKWDGERKLLGKLGKGIDIKGEGGYIVVEPSSHASGGRYSWRAECDPLDGFEAAEAPAWIFAPSAATTATATTPATLSAAVGFIPEQQSLDLRSALAAIPADDRELWVRILLALRSTDAPNAEALAREWSQSSGKYDAKDFARTWASLQPDGRIHVESVFKIAAEHGWANPARGGAHRVPWGEAHDPCTHLANAHRLVTHFGQHLLYVRGIGWHCWAPPWRLDEHGARRCAHQLGKLVASEAAALAAWVADAQDQDERKRREAVMTRRFKWATSSESATCVESSLTMAEALLGIDADTLDADPDLLGMRQGVLDLRTGEHRPHRQADRITKTCGAGFDPAAQAPTWTRVVRETFRDDGALIGYFQRLCGYMLSGHRGEHLLPIFWGSGANGKSTLLGALQAMLGDYAGTAAPDLLIAKAGSEHPTSLADLQGRRLVVVSETGEAGRLNEERAKLLTGGDTITARRMRQDFYQFRPSHLLVLQTNHRPKVQGTDEGVWRRLRLIPFAYTVPKEQRDPQLPRKLLAELPGILTWAWQGWQRYQVHGFNDPPAVRAATADYREASDAVGLFLTEFCDVVPGLTVTAGDLYRAYGQWCEEAGERARSQRDFGMRLSERGFERVRYGGIHRWRGLTVRTEAGTGAPCAPCAPDSGLSATRDASHSGYAEIRGTSGTSGTYGRHRE